MPALILWIVAGISRIFATRLGMWLASALAFLGLQFAVHSFAMEPFLAQIQSVMGSVGGSAIGWLAFFNIDKYISILLSAYTVAAGKQAVMRRRSS